MLSTGLKEGKCVGTLVQPSRDKSIRILISTVMDDLDLVDLIIEITSTLIIKTCQLCECLAGASSWEMRGGIQGSLMFALGR